MIKADEDRNDKHGKRNKRQISLKNSVQWLSNLCAKNKLLILILFIGIFLRLYCIGTESYWLDEAVSIRQSEQPYMVGIEFLKNDVHFPLYFSVLHFWIKSFGTTEAIVRSLSAIFGVIGIIAIYLLARRLFDSRTGIIAAAFLAFSPAAVYYSQEVRLYSLFLLLTICSFYSYFNLLQSSDSMSNYGKISIMTFFWYIFFTVLMLYTHIFAIMTIFLQTIYFVYRIYKNENRERLLFQWSSVLSIIFIIFFPWFRIMFHQINNPSVSWIPIPGSTTLYQTASLIFDNWTIFLFFIFLLIAAAIIPNKIHLAKSDTDKLKMLAFFGISPILMVFIFSLIYQSLFYPKYFFYLIFFYLIAFAFILSKFLDYNKYISIIIFVVLFMFSVSIMIQSSSDDKQDWRGVSARLKQNIPMNDKIFVEPYYAAEPFSYYFNKDCFKEYYINACLFNEDLVFSRNYASNSTDDNTILTTTDGINRLSHYMNDTLWLVMINSTFADKSLYNYIAERKSIGSREQFVGDIVIIKFE